MRVDRPYIFVIRERLSGTILFMGKIARMPAECATAPSSDPTDAAEIVGRARQVRRATSIRRRRSAARCGAVPGRDARARVATTSPSRVERRPAQSVKSAITSTRDAPSTRTSMRSARVTTVVGTRAPAVARRTTPMSLARRQSKRDARVLRARNAARDVLERSPDRRDERRHAARTTPPHRPSPSRRRVAESARTPPSRRSTNPPCRVASSPRGRRTRRGSTVVAPATPSSCSRTTRADEPIVADDPPRVACA